jgi:hypothetical protein
VLNVCYVKLLYVNVCCLSLQLLGWKREVVYRATVDPGTKTLCDVYYYTPDGKKLRSGREVGDYCKHANLAILAIPNHLNPLTNDYFSSFLVDKSDSSLSGENFTFFKEPIGMDSNQEILRYAKTRRVIQLFTMKL